jgi:hypothetical protein
LKRFYSILVFSILVFSCTDEIKPATFNITSIDKAFEAEIVVSYDKAQGNSELSQTINTNIQNAIVNMLGNSGEEKRNLDAALKRFNGEYVNFKNDFPEATEPVWELNIETELTYQSNAIITLAISTYSFEGGAHGNDQIKFLNLDAKTGNILNNNDIIKDEINFKTLAESYFTKSIESEDKDLKPEDFFFGEPFQLPENIGFSEDGLVFLYNVYEVASYAQGYTEFVIPFDDVEPYLKVL